MSKVNLGFLKPTMKDLFLNEANWNNIKDKINEELASNNIIIGGKMYQLTTVKDVQELFRLASFDLSKRPKFKGRKKKVEDVFGFEEEVEEIEEKIEDSLVSAW